MQKNRGDMQHYSRVGRPGLEILLLWGLGGVCSSWSQVKKVGKPDPDLRGDRAMTDNCTPVGSWRRQSLISVAPNMSPIDFSRTSA